MAKAIRLSSDLISPARLTRNNLHSYRLKVKELRDTLQLSDRAGSSKFLGKLGEVKDRIGEWHDWEELVEIATQVLDHGSSCGLMKHMKMVGKAKYDKALLLTERSRSHYLKTRTLTHWESASQRSMVTTPVLEATSAIAEH
jgi:CHAD domain-containing protein